MLHSQSSGPFERQEQLIALLREQGATPEECADLLPTVSRLSEWQAPQPEPADSRRLLARLTSALPAPSPVRQAIREQRQHRLSLLLSIASAQVSLFGLDFWLVSALITLLGAVVVLSKLHIDQALVLRAGGPLLAYLGTIVAFRGREARVLELELVCLPSPLQLAMARLVIVLTYDLCLSLALSLAFWASNNGLALILSWLMPLLLVAGLALLLSLRLSVQAASALAYVIWLAYLTIGSVSYLQSFLFAPMALALSGCIGLILLVTTLLCMHSNMHRLLPHI